MLRQVVSIVRDRFCATGSSAWQRLGHRIEVGEKWAGRMAMPAADRDARPTLVAADYP
jgi:hypothetical protein